MNAYVSDEDIIRYDQTCEVFREEENKIIPQAACEQLHIDINNGNFEGVKKFTTKYKQARIVADQHNTSALMAALYKDFEIFAFFKAKDFLFASYDASLEATRFLSNLNGTYENYFTEWNKHFWERFNFNGLNFYVNFDSETYDNTSVRSALSKLKKGAEENFPDFIEYLKLKNDTQIFVDLKSEYTSNFNPTTKSRGYYSSENKMIVLGGKSLRFDYKEPINTVVNTFVREITHAVAVSAYGSNSNPFPIAHFDSIKESAKKISEFEDANDETKYKKENDLLDQIARAAEFVARYKYSPNLLKEIKEQVPDLFKLLDILDEDIKSLVGSIKSKDTFALPSWSIYTACVFIVIIAIIICVKHFSGENTNNHNHVSETIELNEMNFK
jgi:hypothetical protein